MADNKDIVMRWYKEAWEKADAGPLDELLADDYLDHQPLPGMSGDKASAGQTLTAIMGNTSDASMDVQGIIGEGDFVAAHWHMDWTQHGDFMGMVPAEGKRLSLEGHDFVRLENGKIAEVWHVEDMMSVMGQLGLIPEPPT